MDKTKRQCSKFLPEEVVTIILLKMGIKHLFSCKLVSKQWKSIISHPKFGQNYVQQRRRCSKSFELWEYAFLPHNVDRNRLIKGNEVVVAPLPFLACIGGFFLKADKKIGLFIASSNGLILSSASFRPGMKNHLPLMKLELWVSNPVTKQSVQLPCLSGPFTEFIFGFTTTRGGDFVTYKVVFIKRGANTTQIFSSDSGSWRSVEQPIPCPEAVFLNHNSPKAITRNGILHWFDKKTRTTITYDPYGSPERFGLIPLPTSGSSKVCVDMVVSDHEDVLILGEMEIEPHTTNVDATQIQRMFANERSLRVWRLVDCDKGEWCLEKVCVTSQKKKFQLKDRVPVMLDLDRHRFLGCLFDVSSDPSTVMGLSTSGIEVNPLVPVLSCPWSSPFYGQSG